MDTQEIKPKDEYKVTRMVYIIQCMFEYFISILVSGAYLAKLTTTIGISDTMTAILSSVASLAAMFQVFSIFLAHKTPVKRWVLPMTVIPQVLVATLYLIPFFKLGVLAPILFFVISLINQAAHNIVAPATSNWFFSPVEPSKRGDFQAKISMVSLIGGTIFTFLAGRAMDKFEAEGKLNSLFIYLTIVIFLFALLEMVCLMLAKSDTVKVEKKESPFKSIKTILKNKAFTQMLTLSAIWAVANNIATPFLSTYQIKELGFSMSFISTVTIVLNFLNILIVYLTGKYSKKHSYSSIFKASFVFALLGFAVITFTNPANGHVMFTIYRVFLLFFGATAGISTTALTFAVVEETERTAALAFKSIITGLLGFSTTLLISPLFPILQNSDIVIFGIKFYAQQVLSLVSFCITLLILIYFQFFCTKLNKE